MGPALLGCTSEGKTTPDVFFTVDSTTNAHAISPYIYGTNDSTLPAATKGLALSRVGGNRLTAYNWETNASNAGSDYKYSSDNYLSTSTTPGYLMTKAAQTASDARGQHRLDRPHRWLGGRRRERTLSVATHRRTDRRAFLSHFAEKG
jgi:hypothetical protein